MLAGIQNRLVFGNAGDDVITLFPIHSGHALQRQVVGFGCATGEDNFPGIRSNQKCDLLAGVFDGSFGIPSKLVIAACRIAKLVGKVGHHGIEHSGIERRRCVVIHIYR